MAQTVLEKSGTVSRRGIFQTYVIVGDAYMIVRDDGSCQNPTSTGRLEERMKRAWSLAQDRAQDWKDYQKVQYDLALVHGKIGDVEMDLGQKDKALKGYQESLKYLMAAQGSAANAVAILAVKKMRPPFTKRSAMSSLPWAACRPPRNPMSST